jgi:hypothetical protein
LDCGFWALDFACSADQAFIRFNSNGFFILDLIDAYGTSVCASAASRTFVIGDLNFNHLAFLILLKFDEESGV